MNQRDASRKEWASNNNIESINAGSLQRIADATERMAVNWRTLTEERDMFKRWHDNATELLAREQRRSSALRGVITKLRKKLKEVEGE